MRRPAVQIAALLAVLMLAAVTHRVLGSAVQSDGEPHRVATVNIMTLLEDYLRTEGFKPDRDAFRSEWETRLGDAQSALQQIENELRMAQPNDPNAMQLQQRYQQTAYQFQELQRQASMAFDRFSANQAADAYAQLHEQAVALAEERGYSHLIATRHSGEIDDRGNLSTVTQEILARPMMLAPEGHDITAVLRERMDIPEAPDDAADPTAAEAGPEVGNEGDSADGADGGAEGDTGSADDDSDG